MASRIGAGACVSGSAVAAAWGAAASAGFVSVEDVSTVASSAGAASADGAITAGIDNSGLFNARAVSAADAMVALQPRMAPRISSNGLLMDTIYSRRNKGAAIVAEGGRRVNLGCIIPAMKDIDFCLILR
jgi:hypothetical protein